MDEALVTRYWCHLCSRIVNPIMEVEIKCPLCNNGFIEEMEGQAEANTTAAAAAAAAAATTSAADLNSDHDLSLWAPMMLGMLSDGLRRRRRNRSQTEEEEESETNNNMILINPFNHAVIIQAAFNGNGGDSQGFNHINTSLGDYFIGPGLEQLLQHLAENDPNRRGTPPASKEAVDAMPTVKIEEEKTSCYVCLEDFETGEEAREMPCKHRFHGGCILPWLEAHSSCPVCRYQLPVEEPPKDSNGGGNRSGNMEETNGGNGDNGGNGRRFWIPVPWPFSGFFSSSSSSSSGSSQNNGNGNDNSSSLSSSSSSDGN